MFCPRITISLQPIKPSSTNKKAVPLKIESKSKITAELNLAIRSFFVCGVGGKRGGREEGREGGVLPEKLDGAVRPASQNPYPIYYMKESVLLGTKPLVDSIRYFIGDPSGVYSVCHLCECRIVQ